MTTTGKEALRAKYSTAAPRPLNAIRAAIQRSKASIEALSRRHGINPKTVATEWCQGSHLSSGSVSAEQTSPHDSD
jgi:hypothetical protein